MSWPSAETERLVGAVPQKPARVRLVSHCSRSVCWLVFNLFCLSFYPSSATVFPSVPWRTDRMPQTSNKYSKWRRKRTAEPPETAGSSIPKNWSVTVVTLEPLRAWLRPHSSIRISVTLDWPQTQYCFDCAFNYKLKLPPPFRTSKNKTKVSIKLDFQLRWLNVFS